MAAVADARQRLIARQREMDTGRHPDIAEARRRLRLASANVEAQLGARHLIAAQLERHPFLTILGLAAAGAAIGVLSRRVGPAVAGLASTNLLPLASRLAIAWLLKKNLS